ncbi:MAG: glycine/betaine ABC transporter substrate-binding protein [Colwellia sp.]|nr:glycine/betaine ABC transporter substrate-binding protein [Colwellia sp.]
MPPVSYSHQGNDRILIPLNKWASQRVLSTVVGSLIKDMAIPIEYIDISVDDQWGALQRGAIHFQIEVWQPSMEEAFTPLVNTQTILDMGTHDAVVIEDWWFPEYVAKKCPELPNWQALNKCKYLFAKNSLSTKGIYYTGPWDYGDGDIIRALNLEYSIKRLADDSALWKKLRLALKKKQPILMLNWSPNWTDITVDGRFIAFPPFTPECEQKPEWGINKSLTKDCGNPRSGWLKKAAWPGLKIKNTCVFQLIKKINFTKQMVAKASALNVVDNYSEEEAAAAWINKYQSQVKSWQVNGCEV